MSALILPERPSSPPVLDGLAVRTWTDPIRAKPTVTHFAAGATIAELADAVPLEFEGLRPLLEARINGEVVPHEWWPFVRPKPESAGLVVAVAFHVPLRGGGGKGGKGIISSIAAIALIGAALLTGAGVFAVGGYFAAGSVSAALLGGALAIAGNLLLQGLGAAALPDLKNEGRNGRFSTASSSNEYAPGDQLQRVLGTTRVLPQMVQPPFTTITGTPKSNPADGYTYDQYVTVLYALAGHHQIADIRIGDVEVADMSDIEIEIRDGLASDLPLSLISDTVVEEQLGITMSKWDTDPEDEGDGSIALNGTIAECEPIWHRVETKNSPDSFRMEFVAPGLTYQMDEGPKTVGLLIRSRMRRREASGWGAWVNIPEIYIRGKELSSPVRMHLEVRWVDTVPTGRPWPPTAKPVSQVKGFRYLTGDTYWPSPLNAYYAGTDRFVNWDYESDKKVILNLPVATYPKGRYQFELKKSYPINPAEENALTSDMFSPYWSGTEYRIPRSPALAKDDITITTVQNRWAEYPIGDDGNPLSLIAIRARSRQLGRLSCIATGIIPVWNGLTWAIPAAVEDEDEDGNTIWVIPTAGMDNPAAQYRHVLMDIHNARPVPADLVDEAELADWFEWCAANGKRCCTAVKGMSIVEVLQLIALCGWGSPRFGALHGVVVDRLREEGIAGLITQRNAGAFSFEKPFPERPHALRVTFTDEADDYEAREVIVYDEGYNLDGSGGKLEARKFETVTYQGLPTEALARARGAFDLAWSRYRSRLVRCRQDIEHLEHRRGSLVLLETDILGQTSGRGRVTSILRDGGGLVTGLRLDEERDFSAADSAGAARGAAIRLGDGDVLVKAVTGDDSDLSAIAFATPFAMPTDADGDLILEGAIVATGRLGQEARPMIVQDIAPGQELTAELVLVDYASEAMYGVPFSSAA